MRVGFFDSGVGGRCVLDAFLQICPEAETVYLADTKNCPYGNKSAEEIVRLSLKNAKRLIEKDGCGIVVVACNTATAAAIETLRQTWPGVPFVGIEPAVKPAALRSKSGVVGVLATAGTFGGRLYNETKRKFAGGVTVIATVADEWVTEVEKLGGRTVEELGARERARLKRVVAKRIEPLLKAGADKIVLGCTHFPHLKVLIEEVIGEVATRDEGAKAEVVEPSMAVARQVKRVWEKVRSEE